MIYPKFIEVNGKRYPINTDFRVAIECNRVAEDDSITDIERALGVICLLFGEEALEDTENYEKLLELAQKYLRCGKEEIDNGTEKPDMDYIDTKDIEDTKQKTKIEKAKQQVALKKYKTKKHITEEQKQSARELYEALGFGKE